MRLRGAVVASAPFDGRYLEKDIQKLGSKLYQSVRKGACLPENMRPCLDGLILHDQVVLVWKAFSVFTSRTQNGREKLGDIERIRSVIALYRDLSELGCRIEKVDGLKERHARVLLEHWRKSGKADATIRKNWSILRIWAQALGKPNMIDKLEIYWPQAPKTWLDANKPAGAKWALLTEQQMTELMRASDQTHWYVERLIEAFQVSVEEALLFDKTMTSKYLSGKLVLRSMDRREYRSVEVDSHTKTVLVQELEAFIQQRGRAKLMWQDMTVSEAVRKHQNRVAYLRRKFPKSEVTKGA
jgi:hypothetical protein